MLLIFLMLIIVGILVSSIDPIKESDMPQPTIKHFYKIGDIDNVNVSCDMIEPKFDEYTNITSNRVLVVTIDMYHAKDIIDNYTLVIPTPYINSMSIFIHNAFVEKFKISKTIESNIILDILQYLKKYQKESIKQFDIINKQIKGTKLDFGDPYILTHLSKNK